MFSYSDDWERWIVSSTGLNKYSSRNVIQTKMIATFNIIVIISELKLVPFQSINKASFFIGNILKLEVKFENKC